MTTFCFFSLLQDFGGIFDSLWESWWYFCFMVGISDLILETLSYLCFQFSAYPFLFFIFYEGFQCTVKLSCSSLSTCGTPKWWYDILDCNLVEWQQTLVLLFLTFILVKFFLFGFSMYTSQGTTYVYDSFFRPYLAKHENEIDRNLLELKTRAGDILVLYWQRAASYSQTRIFEILQYVASQSTPRPRPAQVGFFFFFS